MEQFHAVGGERAAEPIDHEGVLLQESDGGAGVDDPLGERAEAGADLDDVVAGLEIEEGDGPAGEILVVEKILAEALPRVSLKLGEGAADFGESH